jgi:hypothetical protein
VILQSVQFVWKLCVVMLQSVQFDWKLCAVMLQSVQFDWKLCAVMLQSCTVCLEVGLGSSSQPGITSSDDLQAVISIKVEENADVTIKVEEIPESISFSPIKAKAEEVSYLSVCTIRHMSVTCLCSLSDTCQLPVFAHYQTHVSYLFVRTIRHMSVTCLRTIRHMSPVSINVQFLSCSLSPFLLSKITALC